jgi:choline kinase
MMKAIILAAGRGSRLKGMTDERPKCLVEIFGQPLLHWQITALRKSGISDIAIVRGYRGEMLSGFGLKTFDNPVWSKTNMVMSLAAAKEWLRTSPCIVSYSDIFYATEAVESLIRSSGPIALTYALNWYDIWSRRFVDPLSDAETFRIDDSGLVEEIGKTPQTIDEIQGQYMGLMKIEPQGWAWIEEEIEGAGREVADKMDMTNLLGRLLAKDRQIRGIPYSGLWGEVDIPSDVDVYRDMRPHFDTDMSRP